MGEKGIHHIIFRVYILGKIFKNLECGQKPICFGMFLFIETHMQNNWLDNLLLSKAFIKGLMSR